MLRNSFIPALLLLLIFGLAGCTDRATKGTNPNNQDADSSSITDEGCSESDLESDYNLQMLFATHYTGQYDDNHDEIRFDCVVFKLNDSFVEFDNDDDYSDLAAKAAFPIIILKEYSFDRKRYDIEPDVLRKQLPESVAKYLGNRKAINKTAPVNKLIDYCFYQYHPYEWDIVLQREGYNYKTYKKYPADKGWSATIDFKPLEGEWGRIVTVDGEEVPQGTLYADL